MSKRKKSNRVTFGKGLGVKVPKYREKAKRLLKRSGRELRKNLPDLDKVQKLQQKAAKLLQKVIKSYQSERSDHQAPGNNDVE
jgi:prefoldin subunit 5